MTTSYASPSPEALPGRRRLQRRAYQLFAALTGAFLIIGGGAVYLTTSWFLPDERPFHGVAFGMTTAVLLGAAVLSTVRRPEHAIAPLQQTVLVLVAFIGLALATAHGNANSLIDAVSLGIPVLVLVVLHPTKRTLLTLPRAADRRMLALAAAAAVPLLAYACAMAMHQLQASASDPMVADGVTRYAALAGAALGLGASALLGATATAGWRVCATTAGVGGTMLALASLLYPRDPGAFGRPLGMLTLIAALAYLAAARHRSSSAAE